MLNNLFVVVQHSGCADLSHQHMVLVNSTLLHSHIQQQCRDLKEMFPSIVLLLSHPTDNVAFILLKFSLSLAETKNSCPPQLLFIHINSADFRKENE